MSSFTGATSGKLIHLSNTFWRALVLEKFDELENILDCECCVLDSFDDVLGSTTGIYVTLGKLKEISARIKTNRLETTIHTLRVMQSHTQTRLFVHSKGGMMSSHLGIAVNWLDDKITGLIIIKNANESTFFIDDTPAPVTSQRRHTQQWQSSSTDTRLAELSASQSRPSDVAEDDPSLALLPPFLCPKPPAIPATLTLTVLSCSNLKSCMKRVISRAVDAYVIVNVNGQERRTEVVTDPNPWFDVDNSFLFQLPVNYQHSTGVGDGDTGTEEDLGTVVNFRIMDKVSFGADQELSAAVLPLASLQGQVDNKTPSDITLPLVLRNKVGMFGFEYPQNTLDDEIPLLKVRASKVDVMEWWNREERRLRAEAREKEAIAKAQAKKHRSISLYSSSSSSSGGKSQTSDKLDHDRRNNGNPTASGPNNSENSSGSGTKATRKGSWTALLGGGERRRGSGSSSGSGSGIKGGSWTGHDESASRGSMGRRSDQGMGFEEVDVRPVMALASKSDWVDSKHVVICMGCLTNFTVTNRKHHCRSCGEVFCKKCSSKRVKLGTSRVRVCSRCFATKRVSTAVLSIERDSMISVADRRSDGDEDDVYSDDDEGFG